MIVSIHQPAYLPWMGYFDKIARSDLFIYLDTVQFQKSSFQNRNLVRTSNGSSWLTVPVKTKGRLYDVPIKDLQINNQVPWRKKHLKTLQQNYSKAKMFEEVIAELEPIYLQEWTELSSLCLAMLEIFNRRLGITTTVVKASDMKKIESKKSDLVLDLCKESGANIYLSGSQGRDYLQMDDFQHNNIDVIFQDYEHPEYTQNYKGFEPYMGIVDLLMNEEEPGRFFQ